MKRHAPATARNTEPIGAVLADELPGTGTVLEIASGTGEHAAAFARRFPNLTWQPTERASHDLGSIRAYRADAGMENLAEPLVLDASSRRWSVTEAAALLCVNMVHISPWTASEGLFAGAGEVLSAGSPLILYGPYREAGVETSPSNEAFDASLKARDPSWGLRRVADMDALAFANGFERTARHAMPANNLVLVYRKV